jgi:AGCS family alanine or glycine:cation symporter
MRCGVLDLLKEIVDVGNTLVWSTPAALPWMVAVLLLTGLFVTVRLSFIQLRQVGHAVRAVFGKYDDPDDEGDISHFQALSTALSATVGIGNIAGVAMAIHYGGPGALFWMWVTAVFGMALKFAECTLSMQYRGFDADGNASGGPMYYIEKGLGKKWKPLAVLFAVCAVISSFGGGNMSQANTVAVSAYSDFGIEGWVVGLVSSAIVGFVILGGIKRIAKVSSKLAPTMATIYIAGALVILILNVNAIPDAFVQIFSQAFNPRASLGGSVAGVFSMTLLWGVKRGLFSNEAGQGSAPIAHAAAKTKEPVREGAVAMLGPLIDTLIICTMTGLVVVTTGVWDEKKQADLGIGEVKTYTAASLPETGTSEAGRIAAAAAVAAKAGDKSTLGAVCGKGHCRSLVFIGRDALIDDAVLEVKTADVSTAFLRGMPLEDSRRVQVWPTEEAGCGGGAEVVGAEVAGVRVK